LSYDEEMSNVIDNILKADNIPLLYYDASEHNLPHKTNKNISRLLII
jgi:hypothetical protein